MYGEKYGEMAINWFGLRQSRNKLLEKRKVSLCGNLFIFDT